MTGFRLPSKLLKRELCREFVTPLAKPTALTSFLLSEKGIRNVSEPFEWRIRQRSRHGSRFSEAERRRTALFIAEHTILTSQLRRLKADSHPRSLRAGIAGVAIESSTLHFYLDRHGLRPRDDNER